MEVKKMDTNKNIQETIQNQVTSILENINEMKKKNKLYIATDYEKELQDIIEQVRVLDIKTREEIEND